MDMMDTDEKTSSNKNSNNGADHSLVGFYHNKGYDLVEFFSVPCSSSQQAPPPYYASYFLANKTNYRAISSQSSSALAVLSSSNGLLLLYTSCFLDRARDSVFIVKNPTNGDSVTGKHPPPVSFKSCLKRLEQKRFLVYGFAFEPNARPSPYYTVVQVTDVVAPEGEGRTLMVWKFNSLSPYWKRKFHEEVDPLLNDVHKKYALLGPSVYLNGNLHWLLQPSGVIAYNIENECFVLSFVKVPGDSMHLDDLGLCNCTKRSPDNNAAVPRSCVCTCRFLGECEGRLAYTRVTGDSCFSIWILKDYQSRFWIHNYWIVEQLPGSLFDGRVLAFGQKADFVLLRVKKNIFSYNFRTRGLKKFHQILKDYAHEDKCDGLLVPYYLPIDHPPVIPLAVRANSPSLSGEGKYIPNPDPSPFFITCLIPLSSNRYTRKCLAVGQGLYTSNAPMDRLFYHYAVSHLAEKYQIRAGLASRIPLRVKLYVRVHHSIDSYKWAVSCYGDLIRLEASFQSGCE